MPTPEQKTVPGVPDRESVAQAVRLLGVAISKVGVYGLKHPAAQTAVRTVFDLLQIELATCHGLGFSASDRGLLVDGEPLDSDPAGGQLLASQIERHRSTGFELHDPLDWDEFSAFVGLLGTPALQFDQDGGIAGVVERAGLRSVRMAAAHYVRVEGDTPPAPPAPAKAPPPPPPARPPTVVRSPAAPRVVDLSLDMALVDGSDDFFSFGNAEPSHPAAAGAGTAQRRLESLVQRLLRVADLLEGRLASSSDLDGAFVQELHESVGIAAGTTREHIRSVASDVAADRHSVAEIEAEARLRGVVLRTSRDALLARLAEIDQEMMQPLTVASGVVDMILAGSLGPLPEKQSEMLKLASESIGLVSQLAAHITELVGYPAGLHPDQNILDAAYGRKPAGRASSGPRR